MRTEPPLTAPVFRSRAQAALLAALLLQEEPLSLTELSEAAQVSYATAHREVGRLLDAGILRQSDAGRTRLLSADPTSPLVAPLREILAVSAGPVVHLRNELTQCEGVESALVFGSFAARAAGSRGPAPRDIDVLIIGNPDTAAVYAAADRVQELVKRPVNLTLLASGEFRGESGFQQQVRSSPTIQIVGKRPW